MSVWLILGAVAAAACALPLGLAIANLKLCARPRQDAAWEDDPPRVFVCIPARNEAANIEACITSVLGGEGTSDTNVRVVVYDDQSEDETPAIVARLAADDDRVRTAPTRPLPDGWNGKQHACWRMARAAIEGDLPGEPPLDDRDLLLFTDADVRFEPGAVRGAVAAMQELDADMVSCFPRQITGSLSEALVVPMMFYLLYGYLPMARMRATTDPSTSAGCGQFLMLTREAYEKSGGHEGFKDSMHDGIKLPRAVRRAGLHSDLFDGTGTASVRMYRGFGETWRGFVKNAYEGLGSPGLLAFITILHAVGHLMPWIGLVWLAVGGRLGEESLAAGLFTLAIAMQLVQRLMLASRLEHTRLGAVLHPLGVVLMTVIQWASFYGHVRGVRAWRGRVATRGASEGTSGGTGSGAAVGPLD